VLAALTSEGVLASLRIEGPANWLATVTIGRQRQL
jgi:hypothetical protein